jgi:hypothetical protein
MIFAELVYRSHYEAVHADLVALLAANFVDVKHGLQGDSHVSVTVGGHEVRLDTFSSMTHWVKADEAGPHILQVIEVLKQIFEVEVHEFPLLEDSEDEPQLNCTGDPAFLKGTLFKPCGRIQLARVLSEAGLRIFVRSNSVWADFCIFLFDKETIEVHGQNSTPVLLLETAGRLSTILSNANISHHFEAYTGTHELLSSFAS